MKTPILIYSVMYLPAKKYGGPITSIRNVVESLSDKYQFYILAANHDFGETAVFDNISDGWNQVGKAMVRYVDPRILNFNSKIIDSICEEISPALIWSSSMFKFGVNVSIMQVCRKRNIPFIISPRGEVTDVTMHMKGWKKIPFAFICKHLDVFKDVYFHVTSQGEIDGLKKYFGIKNGFFNIKNIPSPSTGGKAGYIKKTGDLKLVFISRIQEKKNLLFAIQSIARCKSNVSLDIYGPIESETYWEKCREYINQCPANIKISYKGILSPDEVGGTFSRYDAFIFPTLGENYGHVIAEAIQNECPVLLSRHTTPWDDIDNVAGFTANIDSVDEFSQIIERIAQFDDIQYCNLLNSLRCFKSNHFKNDSVAGHDKMFRTLVNK